MRLNEGAVVALALMVGCVRFGYKDERRAPADHTPDAHPVDAGTVPGIDAGVADAGSWQDAGASDAAMPSDSTLDASMPSDSAQDASNLDAEAGALDATVSQEAGVPDDAAMDGSIDSGSTDAGTSSTGPCAFTATTNAYLGDPHFHGTLALKNTGTATWTTPTIAFDLPSSGYICNDANVLPGAGWTLQSIGGHCAYTKTSPSPSTAPGATLSFEYSSNNSQSVSAPAAANLSVTGCP